jgi:hypothetical protein
MTNQTSLPPAPEGFPAGTMVLARRGILPIETIAAGDEVFTHQRRWRPVLETMCRTADTVRVACASYTSGLVTTADHAFRTRTAPVLLDGGMSAAGWTMARNLTDSHRLASPLDFGEPLPIPGLPASLAGKDQAELFQVVGAMIRLKGAAAAAVRPELVDWLAEHFGEYGSGRRFPAWALTMPEELRTAFLKGLINDAPHRKQNAVSMHSKGFVIGLRLLVCSLGFAGGFSNQSRPGRALWRLSWMREGGRRPDHDGYRWHRALHVERGPETEVFHLYVAEDESYVADGIVA